MSEFEETLTHKTSEGGQEARDAFQKEMDEAFDNATGAEGVMTTPDQLKAFAIALDEIAVAKGVTSRETTDEWVAMAWPCFSNYMEGEGCTKEDMYDALYRVGF